MSPASVTKLADYARRSDVSHHDKLVAIAADVDAIEVLARTNAEAQRATNDAVVVIAEAIDTAIAPAIIRIENAIGEVPDPTALSHASQHDLSPAAIREAALGSGLRRDLAEVRVSLASLDRKLAVAGFGVAAGATILPAIFAALPGTAQVASGVVLALVTALGGIWAARKKAPPALPPKEGTQ